MTKIHIIFMNNYELITMLRCKMMNYELMYPLRTFIMVGVRGSIFFLEVYGFISGMHDHQLPRLESDIDIFG